MTNLVQISNDDGCQELYGSTSRRILADVCWIRSGGEGRRVIVAVQDLNAHSTFSKQSVDVRRNNTLLVEETAHNHGNDGKSLALTM